MTNAHLRALIPNSSSLTDEALAGVYAELRALADAVIDGFVDARQGARPNPGRRGAPADPLRVNPWPVEWGSFFEALAGDASAGVRRPSTGRIAL